MNLDVSTFVPGTNVENAVTLRLKMDRCPWCGIALKDGVCPKCGYTEAR